MTTHGPPLITLREAAIALVARAHGDPLAARLTRAVDAQLARCRIDRADREDVRHDVIVALLAHPAADRAEAPEVACARIAVIARNKAVDHVRTRARQALALGDQALERAEASLDDELEPTEALAHRDRMIADLRRAVERLGTSERTVLRAAAIEGGPAEAQMARTTYYRTLGRTHERLRLDLRGRIAGTGLVAWLLRRVAQLGVPKLGALLAAATVAVALGVAVTTPPPDAPARGGAAVAPAVGRSAATPVIPATSPAAPAAAAVRPAARRVSPLARGGAARVVAVATAALVRPVTRTPARSAARACAVYDPNPYVC